jgi:hypothetical protein
METNEVNCVHACRNTCGMLNEILKKESATLRLYEGVYAECNYPGVKSFLYQMIAQKRKDIMLLTSKLHDIRTNSEIYDGILASFD